MAQQGALSCTPDGCASIRDSAPVAAFVIRFKLDLMPATTAPVMYNVEVQRLPEAVRWNAGLGGGMMVLA